MIDIHSHVLPGFDDGPEEDSQSLALLRGMERLGYEVVVATPHHRYRRWEGTPFPSVRKGVEDLAVRAREAGLTVRILPGMEYDLEEGWEDPGQGPLFILVDAGFGRIPRELPRLLEQAGRGGRRVLLAHPERNPELAGNGELLAALRAGGVFLQGNLGSLGGLYGGGARKFGLDLLERGLYWAFGSDLHSPDNLGQVERGLQELSRLAGPDEARRLTRDNPSTLISPRSAEP